MYSVDKHKIKLSGEEITTFSRTIADACTYEVEAGTNGFKGGNTKAGSRTFVEIRASSNSDLIAISNAGQDDKRKVVTFFASGDAELYGLLNSFKFVVKVLEDQIKGVRD